MRQYDVGCFLRAGFLNTLCSEVPPDMYRLAASVPDPHQLPNGPANVDVERHRLRHRTDLVGAR
jgi:hypothetical protein